jgi:hypothetical protein
MAEHARKIGKVQTINAQTGEVVEEKQNAFTMLPPADCVCPVCATDHEHDQPHNQQSLYYRMRFHGEHGRWPTWTDAMAHCAPEVREAWRLGLIEQMKAHGIEVPADLRADISAKR